MLDTQYWVDMYQEKGAFFVHGGSPEQPHALLSSRRHSPMFFNSGKAMEDPFVLEEACRVLARKLRDVGVDLNRIDRVAAPAMGGINLAYELARQITLNRARYVRPDSVLWCYAEKTMDGQFKFERIEPKEGELFLPSEDALTTGESVDKMIEAVRYYNVIVRPYVLALVNRSGKTVINGRQIISLVEREIPSYAADDCPECKLGSRAVLPKLANNWELLMKKY